MCVCVCVCVCLCFCVRERERESECVRICECLPIPAPRWDTLSDFSAKVENRVFLLLCWLSYLDQRYESPHSIFLFTNNMNENSWIQDVTKDMSIF